MSLNVSAISPAPTEEEAVAITAAITMMWPQPYNAPVVAAPQSAWRFSGRWWDTNSISRRRRPGA